MSTFIQRLVAEREELNEKIEKLSDFLKTQTVVTGEALTLLELQLDVMNAYLHILEKRIKLLV